MHADPVGIDVLENRVIKFANDSMCSMTGDAREEFLEQIAIIVDESERAYHWVGKVKYTQIKEKGTGATETRFKSKVGRGPDVCFSSRAVDPSHPSQGVAFNDLYLSYRRLVEKALHKLHEKLGSQVQERTAELNRANKQLRFEIEKRKHAEEWLRESEEKLARIIASVTDHMSMIDEHYKIIWANDVEKSRLGKDIVGKKCHSAYFGRDIPCGRCGTRDCFEDGKIHEREQEVIEPDENRIYLRCTVSVAERHQDGRPKTVIQVRHNITERKRAENEPRVALARAREERLKSEAIVANIGNGLGIWDSDSKLLYQNKVLKDVVGDHIGTYCYKAFHNRDEVCENCPAFESFKDGKIHTSETALQTEKGTSYLECIASPLRASAGKIIGGVTVFRDFTARKKIEEVLRHTNEELFQDSKERKRLSRTLIHLLESDRHKISMELHDHVGQMLTSLKMDLERAKKHEKATVDFLKDQIQAAVDKTMQCLRDIKDISSGLRPSTLDSLGLVPSFRALLDEIKEANDIKVHFFSKNVPTRLDSEKALTLYRIVQEAMANILTHARAKKVFVNLVGKDEVLSLTVEDDGVGFEPEKTKTSRGSKGGIGLPIMRERTKQLGGEFSIESRVGGGTLLLAEIPV